MYALFLVVWSGDHILFDAVEHAQAKALESHTCGFQEALRIRLPVN